MIISHVIVGIILQLSLSEYLPKQICGSCQIKIEDIDQFRKNVMQNEQTLMQNLSKDFTTNYLKHIIIETRDEKKILKSDIVVKEEEEDDHNSNHFEVYIPPHSNSLDVQRIKTESEADLDVKYKTSKKVKATPKARVKKKLSNKTRSPKVERKVIRNDKYAEHDPNKCLTCFKLCDSSLDLSKHYKNEHCIKPGSLQPENDMSDKYTLHAPDGQKPLYKCNTCGDSYEEVNEITKHVILHKYERPYICKLCGE